MDNFDQARSTTHTGKTTDPWWEVDLKSTFPIERVVVWNRTDASGDRLNGFPHFAHDEKRSVVWQQDGQPAPKPSAEFHPDGARPVTLSVRGLTFPKRISLPLTCSTTKTPPLVVGPSRPSTTSLIS
jgi:hypothetical protein